MRLQISRVEERDFDAIVPVLFNAFSVNDLATVFFGRKSPSSYAHCKRFLVNMWKTDPADLFLKMEDLDEQAEVDLLDENGHSTGKETRQRLVCASNWKIYPRVVTPEEVAALDPAETNGDASAQEPKKKGADLTYFATDEERADAAVILEDFLARRRRACTEGHVLCFLLFTDPAYHGKGAGRMMMQWGNDAADALMLPCWIEASPHGEHLYLKYGYEEKERVHLQTSNFLSEYAHMRRPCMVSKATFEDGKMVRLV